MDLEQWCLSHPSYVAHAHTPLWEERRTKVVTGTGVASLVGLNPWRGREALLTSYLSPSLFVENHNTFWGAQLESSILAGYAKLTGLRIVNTNAYFERDLVGSTVDGLVDPESLKDLLPASEGYVGTTAPTYWRTGIEALQYLLWREQPILCECKMTSERNKGEWGKTVPKHYWAQLQAQLYVTGLDVAIIVANIGGKDIRHHVVDRDIAFQQKMVVEAKKFMEEVDFGKSF